VRTTTGAVAVQQSKRAREQQEVMRVETESRSSGIKAAGGKTFYLRDGVWTDSEFKAGTTMPQTVVKFGSDEYFALLKQKPRLAEFFSLGERVVVILDGRIYRVNAGN
jgi:Ca-activated chloride channel family protein